MTPPLPPFPLVLRLSKDAHPGRPPPAHLTQISTTPPRTQSVRHEALEGCASRSSLLLLGAYSNIEETTSSMLLWTSRSSVKAQTTATWHARRAGIPSWIRRPA